jgi:hypothetical protein
MATKLNAPEDTFRVDLIDPYGEVFALIGAVTTAGWKLNVEQEGSPESLVFTVTGTPLATGTRGVRGVWTYTSESGWERSTTEQVWETKAGAKAEQRTVDQLIAYVGQRIAPWAFLDIDAAPAPKPAPTKARKGAKAKAAAPAKAAEAKPLVSGEEVLED